MGRLENRRWMSITHSPAGELELPRPEKRLPQQALSLSEIDRLLNVPNVADPLGVRDRAILELFYSTGLRRAELPPGTVRRERGAADPHGAARQGQKGSRRPGRRSGSSSGLSATCAKCGRGSCSTRARRRSSSPVTEAGLIRMSFRAW